MRVDAVQTIKDRLTMREVLLHYGYEPNRAKFICCPFHNEKTPSMKIYEQDFHCFGCREHGDTISFVGKLFNLDFKETLKKIDLDFRLNLYGEHSFDELRRSYYKQKQIQAERKRKNQQKEQSENEYWAVFGEYARLFRNKVLYEPTTMDSEQWHPLFVEALQKLTYQEYLLEQAEIKRCSCE